MSRFKDLGTDLDLQFGADIDANFQKADEELTRIEGEMDTTDASLQSQITAEQLARIEAVNNHIQAIVAHAASAISLAAVTGMTATTVQAAIAELRNLLTTIIAGPAPSAEEIMAARVGADNIARASLDLLIKEIHAKQLDAAKQTAVLKHGLQAVTVTQPAPLELTGVPVNVLSTTKYLAIYGQTGVNLLGNDGNFEKDSDGNGLADGWLYSYSSNNLATFMLDAGKFGKYSQKMTSNGTTNPRIFKNIVGLDASKYYIVGIWVKATSANTDVRIGNAVSHSEYTFKRVVLTGGADWTLIWAKVTGVTQLNITVYINGSTPTDSIWMDGAFLYEITATDYVDPSTDNIVDKWPYVDGIQHVTNPMVQVVADNLIKPFTGWDSIHASAVIESPYTLKIPAGSSGNVQSYVVVDVLPNTDYTLLKTGSGRSSVGAGGSTTNILSDSTANTRTFNSGSNTQVTIAFNKASTDTSEITFTNPMLVLGSTAPTEFKPYNEQCLYGVADSKGNPLKLAGDDKTGVRDLLYQAGNEWRKLKRWQQDVVLDGSMAWSQGNDFAGYKYVSAPITDAAFYTSKAIKYDGKPMLDIGNGAVFSSGDQVQLHSVGKIFITISDSDSGWGDNYNPNGQEISAVMNGWVAKTVDGTGKPTAWKSKLDGTDAPTQTLTYVSTTKAAGWTAYAWLTYQLANETSEVVNVEGSLMLGNGGNHVTVGEAVIVREPVTPQAGTTGAYYINAYNNTNSSLIGVDSKLENKTNNIIAIFKNGIDDMKNWTLSGASSTNGNGTAIYACTAANFDPTAEYTVTYIALDKYAMSANVTEVYGGYETTPKAVQDEMLNDITDLRRDVSVNVWSIAELYRRVVALGG